MTRFVSRAALAALALLVSDVAAPAEVFAYPPQGRTERQQRQDSFECHEWAVAQSKFDPVAFSAQSAAPGSTSTAASSANSAASSAGGANAQKYDPSQTGRAVIGGAAAGAAIGEVTSNDADQGAVTGAAVGLLRGKMAERKAASERAAAQAQTQQRTQQQQASKSEELRAKQHAYQTARGTCLTAKGYTVSTT